jgi:hypothetical protein
MEVKERVKLYLTAPAGKYIFPNFLSKTWVCLMVWKNGLFVELKHFSAL